MKVSIIIPAYNRAHLIGETLNSIMAQTYTNWECLIIDDGSTDNSEQVYEVYKNRDARFVFFKRPALKPKGANACRNIGLKEASGDYVVFFDSDDLMTENHLEVKVNAIQKFDCDYVITRTQYFNYKNDDINNYYNLDKFPLTAFNYVSQKVNWLTLDVCVESSLARSILFNEDLQSGQEYNYFSKLVHNSINAEFLNEVVSLRRRHENSIRGKIDNKSKLIFEAFQSKWLTYLDLKTIAGKDSKIFLIKKCLFYVAKGRSISYPSQKFKFIKSIFKELNLRAFYFFPMWLCFSVSESKGYFFYRRLNGSKTIHLR